MKREEVNKKYPTKEFGEVNVRMDTRYRKTGKKNQWGNDKYDYEGEVDIIGWEFYLNHSCDEWVIGNLSDAQKFHENLAEAIEYIETLSL